MEAIRFMSGKELLNRVEESENTYNQEASQLRRGIKEFTEYYAKPNKHCKNIDKYFMRDKIVENYTDSPLLVISKDIKELHNKLDKYVPATSPQEEKVKGWTNFVEDYMKKSLQIPMVRPPSSYQFKKDLGTLENILSSGKLPDEKFTRKIFIEKFKGLEKEPYEYAVIFDGEHFQPYPHKCTSMFSLVPDIDYWGTLNQESSQGISTIQCLWEDNQSEEFLKQLKIKCPKFTANKQRLI